MKKLYTFLALTLAVVFFATTVQAADIQGALSGVKGKVEVVSGGSTAPATDGMKVGAGDTIKTGADGEVVVSWKGGHGVKVSALSMVKVDKLTADASGKSTSELSMEKGKILASAGKLTSGSSYTVKTPSAVAGVRGSGFEMNMPPVPPGQPIIVEVAVVDGSIVLSANGVEVVMDMGTISSVLPGNPPADPTQMPPQRLNSMKSEFGNLKIHVRATLQEMGDDPGDDEEEMDDEEEDEEDEEEMSEDDEDMDDEDMDDEDMDMDEDMDDDDMAMDDDMDYGDEFGDDMLDDIIDTTTDELLDDGTLDDVISDIYDDLDELCTDGACIAGTISVH